MRHELSPTATLFHADCRGAAAALEGFNVILCERESEYVTDIRKRFGTPRLVLPLSQLRQELAILPALAELRERLGARA